MPFLAIQVRGQLDLPQMAKMEAPSNISARSVEFLFFDWRHPDSAPHRVQSPQKVGRRFDPALETVVIIHGFADYYPGSYLIPALVQGYARLGKRNIVAVDWGDLAAAPWYLTAARNSYRVGESLAEFLEDMAEERELKMTKLEMVGFSLGAHVAGVAASLLRDKPKRIIGLDPAELLFAESPKSLVIDKSDGPLVEIVHTSGGFLGFKRPLGHRDFYPNGGMHPQPGCEGDLAGLCSHRRAYQYFAEALDRRGRAFRAVLCSSVSEVARGGCKGTSELGLFNTDFSPSLRGLFYLATNSRKPYARSTP